MDNVSAVYSLSRRVTNIFKCNNVSSCGMDTEMFQKVLFDPVEGQSFAGQSRDEECSHVVMGDDL